MQENPYDTPEFFAAYSRFPRSVQGLSAAGEWHELQKLLPPMAGKRMLDIGCGFGWHCIWAAERGAAAVVGTDISEKMLAEARRKTTSPVVEYRRMAMEDLAFPPASFELVLSSLALHYSPDFAGLAGRVAEWLTPGGAFVFSVEHPVFTAEGRQDWLRDENGAPRHWPVDRYFDEGERQAEFLGNPVCKYHKTLTSYLNGLLQSGLIIKAVVEPQPDPRLLDEVPGMRDELRRPMMLLVSAQKPEEPHA